MQLPARNKKSNLEGWILQNYCNVLLIETGYKKME
jgi:hypothetical protein